jgi:uncharacterized protein
MSPKVDRLLFLSRLVICINLINFWTIKAAADETNEFRLFRAASGGNKKDAKLLLAAGTNVNAREYEGETPLMYAAQAGRTEMVLFLLGRGADINAVSNNGETALVRAVGYPATVKVLLEKGADVELGAPLISAGYSGLIDTVKVLLKYGANPNAKLLDGDTALMAAAIQSGSKDVVKVLIAAGADVSYKNKRGKTAEMLARENGHADLAEFLREAGTHKSR